VAAEQKYDWGAGMRGYKAPYYLHEVSTCEDRELGGAPSSTALVSENLIFTIFPGEHALMSFLLCAYTQAR